MNFHHDAVRDDRFTRSPYMPCDWLCAIHYLTDVVPGAPCFCVVPDSHRFETLQAAFAGLGELYFRSSWTSLASAAACRITCSSARSTR